MCIRDSAKTGLCALTEPQVCALENYAYTWSPNAAAWRTKFEKCPKGFGENEPVSYTHLDVYKRQR